MYWDLDGSFSRPCRSKPAPLRCGGRPNWGGQDQFGATIVREFRQRLECLEQAEENPFLERFYKDPKAALPTQLFFLFQRARQIESLRQEDMFAPVRV